MILTWTGSDVLCATSYPKQLRKTEYIYCLKCRIFAKIADRFVQYHVVVSGHLIKELRPLKLKKPFVIRENPVNHTEKYPKKAHEGFNVLYYRGGGDKFRNWIYGYDLIERAMRYFPHINFIEVTGKSDMSEIFPIVDIYIRPNRHDGEPRLTRECDIQDIPYYHTYFNPSYPGLINFIYDELARTTR